MPAPTSSSPLQSRKLALLFLRSRAPELDLEYVRKRLPPDQYGPFQDELRRLQPGEKRVAAALLAPSLAQLAALSYIGLLGPEREIKWAKSVLVRHAPELNVFLRYRGEFSRAVLTGQYAAAKQCLDEVEAQFGQSFWLIKNRLALLQLSAGLEAQKRYAQHLKKAVGYTGPIATVTHWVSARNESTVSTTRLENEFGQFLARIAPHVEEGVVEYLRFHILPSAVQTPAASLQVLYLEANRALIDFYEAFIAYGRAIALAGETSQRTLVLYAGRTLVPRLGDQRLHVLLTVLTPAGADISLMPVATASYDYLLAGEYTAAHAASEHELRTTPDDAVALALAALSGELARNQGADTGADEVSVPGDAPQATLLQGLRAIVRTGAAAHQSIRELGKLTLNFAALDWAAAFNLLVADELSSQVSDNPTAGAALVVSRWHPVVLDALGPKWAATRYADVLRAEAGASLGIRYALARVGGPAPPVAGLSAEATQLLAGYQSFRAGQYAAAAQHGRVLTVSAHGYFQRRGHRLFANSLLRSGELAEACDYLAGVYLHHPHLVPLLPLAEAVGNLRPSQPAWQQVHRLLALPILLDAHTKHVSRTTEALGGYAYEDFLLAHGVERPSQLPDLAQFDQAQLIYYLRYVCVEAVMDSSTAYQGSHEVAEERLNVCRLLVELDPDQEADYRLEINELVRRQVISKRKREVEQSRIHIELPKLHNWAATQLQEVFNRYVTFLRAGLDEEASPARAEALLQAHEPDGDIPALSVPNNEAVLLFSTLVLELRNAYTSSAEFGLNRYLSTRIRHGTLETQLRRPIAAHNLITQRESENGPYQANTYWTTQLSLDATEQGAFNKVFADFSADYDQLIASIRTNWVQIRLRADQEGMFDFTLSGVQLAWLAAKVTPQTSFRDFVDIVVQYLGERLTANLESIRQRLLQQALPAARELLSDLQRKLYELHPWYMYTELDGAIKMARTETGTVFERVTAWFRPTQAVGSSPYFLEDVLSVAEALVRETAPDFRAPITTAFTNAENQVVLYHGLTTLVDIFVNIFENVVRRSGLDIPQARVELKNVALTPTRSLMCVVTRNALGAAVNREALLAQLAQKRQELAEGKYASAITKEGGSGFFKIHRSLRDFRASDLEFGIENDEFFVEVRFPIDWRRVTKPDDSRLEYEPA